MASAILKDVAYTLGAPQPVGDLTSFITRIEQQRGPNGIALVGFDFPIGLPARYAQQVGVTNFPSFLVSLASEEQSDFYRVCDDAHEITHRRPFYPNNSGARKQSHLLEGHNVTHLDHLRRTCELRQPNRRAANPLFWTLGANQVGKGAIEGWKQVLAPALPEHRVKLWPFDGTLPDLLRPGHMVVAETYPTHYHHWLTGKEFRGKGNIGHRQQLAPTLLNWAQSKSLHLSPGLIANIKTGFPNDDAFDAFIGLLGMLEVAQGNRPPGEPTDPTIREIEGWILGQPYNSPL